MNRFAIRIGIFAVVLVGVLGYRILFVDSNEVINFNDKLVGIMSKSDLRYKDFLGILDAYHEGQKVDADAMTQARTTMEENIRKDLDQVSQMAVPDDEVCKEFHGTCKSYIENSLNVTDMYKEVVAYISTHNPGGEEDFAKVDAITQAVLAKDEQLMKAVGQCQRQMADKFDFKLE